MAAVQTVGASYVTISGALASDNLTTVYTCGDQKETYADVTGILVAASTANADTCSVYRHQASDNTDYALVFKGPVEVDFGLQLEGLPVHLTTGDAIKLQATDGVTHPLHYHISLNKITKTPGK